VLLVWLGAVFVVAMAGVLAYRLRVPPSLIEQARARPLLGSGDAPEGAPVRLRGRVAVLERTVRSPIEDRPCVLVETVRTRLDRNALGGGAVWHDAGRERRAVPFIVEDDQGRIIVDPTDAAIVLTPDASERGPESRLVEARIEPGDLIEIVGRAVREPDPDASRARGDYRDGPAMRLRLAGTADDPVVISDLVEDAAS